MALTVLPGQYVILDEDVAYAAAVRHDGVLLATASGTADTAGEEPATRWRLSRAGG